MSVPVPVVVLLVVMLAAIAGLYAVEIWFHTPRRPAQRPTETSLIAAVGAGSPLPAAVRVELAALLATVGMHAAEHGDPDEVAAPCVLCDIAKGYHAFVAAS